MFDHSKEWEASVRDAHLRCDAREQGIAGAEGLDAYMTSRDLEEMADELDAIAEAQSDSYLTHLSEGLRTRAEAYLRKAKEAPIPPAVVLAPELMAERHNVAVESLFPKGGWWVDTPDGVRWFKTEEEAYGYQRIWHEAHGLHPLTGHKENEHAKPHHPRG